MFSGGIKRDQWHKVGQIVPIDAFYDVQENWSFIWIIRTVKKEMSRCFNIFTTAENWVKWILKTMFEFMLTKMPQT